MIRRIQRRHDFDTLSRDGRRIRRASLWCQWSPLPHTNATQVAFSIGRAYGPAVRRNRLRRRLRAILRDLDRQGLPPGLLMIGARPTANELTFDQLRAAVTELCAALTPPTAATSTASTPTPTDPTAPTPTPTATMPIPTTPTPTGTC